MTQERTSVVTKVGANFREFSGQYGKNYVHLIAFSNGDSGEYYSINKECTKFCEGEEITIPLKKKPIKEKQY